MSVIAVAGALIVALLVYAALNRAAEKNDIGFGVMVADAQAGKSTR